MGYSIIFTTHVVKLDDGRIVMLQRNGCNNDDVGRRSDEFMGKLFKDEDAFVAYAEKYRTGSCPYKGNEERGWELRIGSRYCNMYDYADYLLKKLRRAKPLDEFTRDYYLAARYCTGIRVLEPVQKLMSVADFDAGYSELLSQTGHLSYRRECEFSPRLKDMLAWLEDENIAPNLEFTVQKYKKY